MADHIQSHSAASRVAPAALPTSFAKAGASPAATGAAFHALLERLETHARELEVQARSIESPQELTGAVDRAHASLQDVLSLGDRLVEAYREALARNPAAPPPGGEATQGGKS